MTLEGPEGGRGGLEGRGGGCLYIYSALSLFHLSFSPLSPLIPSPSIMSLSTTIQTPSVKYEQPLGLYVLFL